MLNSLYFRLNLTAVLILIVFFSTTGVVLDHAFAESARQSLRERMLGQIFQLITTSKIEGNGQLTMPLPVDLPYPQLALPNSGLYAFVSRNDDSKVLWHSPSLSNRQIPTPFTLQVGEKYWLDVIGQDENTYALLGFGFQRTTQSGIYQYNFHLMNELAPLYKQVNNYRQRLWGGLAAAAFLLLVTQILLLRWGLQPLCKVTNEVSSIEAGEQQQIKGHYPREVKKLSDNINKLLEQERNRQTRYRNALADLAHSLKTPLAVLANATDQPEKLPDVVSEQSARMLRIVEHQLQRAGTASNLTNLPTLPVHQITERIIASFHKVYGYKNINVQNQITANLNLRFDESDFIEILGNLLDNAFKWSNSTIQITGYKTKNGQIIITIEDDGIGIRPEDIDRILQRGGRADELTQGNGIGLSVAVDIVEAYQGRLGITSSRLGGAAVSIAFIES